LVTPLTAAALPWLLGGCSESAGADAEAENGAIVVGPHGDDSASGTAAKPFRSLKRALAAAKSGSLIRLKSGTYSTESGETWDYELPSNITLVGEDTTATILAAPATSTDGAVLQAFRAHGDLHLQKLSLIGFQHSLDVEVTAHVEIDDAELHGDVFINAVGSSLTLERVSIEGKNAAINFFGENLSIADSELHAATGSYGISLRSGTLSLTNSSVDGGNYGVYQLAGASRLRQARVIDFSSVGFYFAAGSLDLGSAIESGDNTFEGRPNTDAFGLYVDTGTAPVTCSNTSFNGVVPPAGTVRADTNDISEPHEYVITPGQSVRFFDAAK
jgi:hypothetical protein